MTNDTIPWLGIDFGTSFSSAALLHDGKPRAVQFGANQTSLPSSAFVLSAEQILVGQAAENRHKTSPERYRRAFKRDLGSDAPYYLSDGLSVRPEQLVASVIGRLKAEAEKVQNAALSQLVLTVPATYQEHRRELMRRAALSAGFGRVELLEEPVAAAFYYTWGGAARSFEVGETILIYDLGGGTFDAALVQRHGSGFRFLGYPMGLEHCGGIDFDRAIYAELLEQSSQPVRDLLEGRHGSGHEAQLQTLRARALMSDACRALKEQLSEETHAEQLVPIGGDYAIFQLSRERLRELIAPRIDETLACCQQLLQSAGIGWDGVGHVLMVGGSCRIPFIQEALSAASGRPVERVDQPELAVALGAALFGREQGERERGIVVSTTGEWATYPSIAAALEVAPEGATITLRPGVYAERLELDRVLTLAADGEPGSVAIAAEDGPAITLRADAALRGITVRQTGTASPQGEPGAVRILAGKALLKACTITSSQGVGVYIAGETAAPVLDGCRVSDCVGHGVLVVDGAKATLSSCTLTGSRESNLVVERGGKPNLRGCTLTTSQRAGVSVASEGAAQFVDCTIGDFGQWGVLVRQGGKVSMQGCRVRAGKGHGIAFQRGSDGRLADCTIEGSSSAAVLIGPGCNPSLASCKILGSAQTGVRVEGDGRGLLMDTVIAGHAHNGVTVEEGGAPELHACELRGNKQYGLLLQSGARGTFAGCTLAENGLQGAWINGPGGVSFSSCRFERNSGGGALLQGKAEPEFVSNCVFEGNNDYAIAAYDSKPTLKHATLSNRGGGLQLFAGSEAVVRNCKFSNHGGIGIWAHQGSVLLMRESTITGSGGSGVLLQERSTGVLYRCTLHKNAAHGLHAAQGARVELSRSWLNENTKSGVYVGGGGTLAAERCELSSNGADGITLEAGSRHQIELCRIEANTEDGLYLHKGAQATLKSCWLAKNRIASFRLAQGAQLEASENFPLSEAEVRAAVEQSRVFSPDFLVYARPPVSGRFANAARNCRLPDHEQVIAQIDCTFSQSGEDGVLIGLDGIYYHNSGGFKATFARGAGSLAYSEFPERAFKERSGEVSLGNNQYINQWGSRVSISAIIRVLDTLRAAIVRRKDALITKVGPLGSD